MRILCLLVALLAPSVAAEAQSWITYESAAGHYRIDMPTQPHVHSETLPYNGGILNISTASVKVGAGTCSADYTDYPADVSPLTPEQSHDSIAKDQRLIRGTPITIAGHPGHEVVFTRLAGDHGGKAFIYTDDDYTIVHRSTLVGTRLYQLSCGAPGDTEPNSPDVKRFLDSFALR